MECIQNEKKVSNTDINKLNWRFKHIYFFSDHKPGHLPYVSMVHFFYKNNFIRTQVEIFEEIRTKEEQHENVLWLPNSNLSRNLFSVFYFKVKLREYTDKPVSRREITATFLSF